MRIHKQFIKRIALSTMLTTCFAAYGIAQDTATIEEPESKAPVIVTTSPSGDERNVDLGSVIEITFSSEMDENSVNGTTFLLHTTSADSMHEVKSEVVLDNQTRELSAIQDSLNSWQPTIGSVKGTISYSDKVAVFTPDEELKEGTLYTFTVTNGVKDLENNPLENNQKWSFITTGQTSSSQ